MHAFINSPLQIGSLILPNRLIQGPLAGYSCAPFRTLFQHYKAPAYCVSEMISAHDVLHKHELSSRYLFRAAQEQILAYQISGTSAEILAQAAFYLQTLGADLIDINCGCPKLKIRKKGAGSALLENSAQLMNLITAVKAAITIPLTVKIRLQKNQEDFNLANKIAAAGADALIIHGRHWRENYDVAADWRRIGEIKQTISIPVIVNGDISNQHSLEQALYSSGCDAVMIARAGSGRPWLYQELLESRTLSVDLTTRSTLFITHLHDLAQLENEYKAVLQSKSLVRYYFRDLLPKASYQRFYALNSLAAIELFLRQLAS